MNSKTKISHVERLGLEAVTTIQSRAFFFLFVEIDTKDKAVLQSLIKYITNRKISVIVYESNKGYHIVSPSLLHFQECFGIMLILVKLTKFQKLY